MRITTGIIRKKGSFLIWVEHLAAVESWQVQVEQDQVGLISAEDFSSQQIGQVIQGEPSVRDDRQAMGDFWIRGVRAR